ncbi:MAG: hypothetical protein ABUL61_02380, partial [Oleiharenicola lentus]
SRPMPAFLFRARDAQGGVVEDHIEAATLGQARYALELRGCTDIEFHTGESQEEIMRAVRSGSGVEPADPEEWTAADEIASHQRKGLVAKFWWALKQHAPYFGLLLVWNYFSWRGDRPFSWGDWLGFVLTPLYAVYFLAVVTPMLAFDQLLQAAVWRDWPVQRRYIAFLRFSRALIRMGVSENELLWREANALAAGGNLTAALAHVAPLKGHPDVAEFLYWSRASTLHEFAGDYHGQLKCVEQAIASKPEGTDSYIDLAAVRILRFRDVAGARAALAKIEDKELAETARGVYLLVRGVTDVEARDYAAGEKDLREAEAILSQIGNALILGFLADLQAYLALALVATGRPQEARSRYLSVRPLLVAQKADHLLARVDVAVGGTVPLKN